MSSRQFKLLHVFSFSRLQFLNCCLFTRYYALYRCRRELVQVCIHVIITNLLIVAWSESMSEDDGCRWVVCV